MSTPAFRRIVRRETHSPRTVAFIVVVVILLAVLVWIGTEICLYLAAQPALLVGPGVAIAWIIGLPGAQPSWLVATGAAILAIAGLIFVGLAVAPGRLPKHEMMWSNRAVVIDNGVIAAALAQHVSDETGISRDHLTVGVSHRTADVTLSPGFGAPLDAEPVKDLVEAEIASYQLKPRLKARVRVSRASGLENAS